MLQAVQVGLLLLASATPQTEITQALATSQVSSLGSGSVVAAKGLDQPGADKVLGHHGALGVDESAVPKADTVAAQLLLPYFMVDQTNASGTTTLYALRNETDQQVQVTARYHLSGQPQTLFQTSETFDLGPKEVRPINIRSVDGLFVDNEGQSTGYVTFESNTADSLQGDFFLLTPGEAFASGDRLVNIDPTSPHFEPCNRITMRYLNGGAFSGGTIYTIWLETDEAIDSSETLFNYSVYSESGGAPVLVGSFNSDDVAIRAPAGELLVTPLPVTVPDFGALEFVFTEGRRGHIAAVMDARGLFSVGLKGACGDP